MGKFSVILLYIVTQKGLLKKIASTVLNAPMVRKAGKIGFMEYVVTDLSVYPSEFLFVKEEIPHRAAFHHSNLLLFRWSYGKMKPGGVEMLH